MSVSSIRSQLLMLAVTCLALVVGLSVMVVMGSSGDAAALRDLNERSFQPLLALQDVDRKLKELRFRLAGVLLGQIPVTGSRNHLKEVRETAHAAWKRFATASRVIEGNHRELVTQIDNGWEKFSVFAGELELAYANNNRKKMTTLLEDDWPGVHIALVKPLEQLLPQAIKMAETVYAERSLAAERRQLIAISSLMAGGFLLSLFLLWFYRRLRGALAELQSEVVRAEAALAEKAETELVLRENEAKITRQARCERLLEALAAASNTARTPDDAMSSFLRQICEFSGWPLGRASLADMSGGNAITRADFWHHPGGEAYDRYVEASSHERHNVASGIFVGKVLRTCAPVWIADLTLIPGYARAAVFSQLGLRAGMAFPIVRGREPIGFFEFHSAQALQPDPELIALIERASAYIGGVADRVESAEQIRRLNTDLERRVAERTLQSETANAMLAARGRDAELLGEMTGVLQIAENLDEAGMLVSRYLPAALQGATSGALYLMRASRDNLERLSVWGSSGGALSFPPVQCWGMRRGQPHGSLDGAVPLMCSHTAADEAPGGTLCLPLVAQGESLGVLQIGYAEAGDTDRRRERTAVAKRVAEQLSLALANVRLRDSLREQSIRDTLTGLHNRRYLEESLHRELARCGREKQTLALFMLDVDHFKRYNDTHGHDAGDAALRELGRELRESARESDIVCRYGGEEFTAVLPNTGQEEASAWSERLMRNVRAMDVRLGSGTLPSVTLSMGLAVYPHHGNSVDALLRAADAALYVAKHEGRDRLRVVDFTAQGAPQQETTLPDHCGRRSAA